MNADLIGRPEWTPARYATVVRAPDDSGGVVPENVEGEVRGRFGLDVRPSQGLLGGDLWVLTHLATGYRLPRDFVSRQAAAACAERLEELGCWDIDDPKALSAHPDAARAGFVLRSAPGGLSSGVLV